MKIQDTWPTITICRIRVKVGLSQQRSQSIVLIKRVIMENKLNKLMAGLVIQSYMIMEIKATI